MWGEATPPPPSIALPQQQVFFLFCIISNFSTYVYSLLNYKQDMSTQYQKKFEGQTWKFFICLFSYLAFLNIQLDPKISVLYIIFSFCEVFDCKISMVQFIMASIYMYMYPSSIGSSGRHGGHMSPPFFYRKCLNSA